MNTDIARQRMVEQQIRTWDVLEPSVLAVMKRLARHRFMPDDYAHLAYAETEIPLGHGQTTLTPNVEGRLLQALALRSDQSVLEIGTGSGYLTACLASLADNVCSIDIHQDFVDRAAEKLADADIGNASCLCMDATTGLPDGQFDAIAVTASLPRPDGRLLESLTPGGRMFVVIGEPPVMSAQLVTRGDGTEWQSTSLFETELAPLLNIAAIPSFVF